MKHASIHVSVPSPMKEYVDSRVASGEFGTVSDYVRALIRAEQKERARETLEARLLEALDSGPATEMTAEDWADIRREVADRLEKRKQSG